MEFFPNGFLVFQPRIETILDHQFLCRHLATIGHRNVEGNLAADVHLIGASDANVDRRRNGCGRGRSDGCGGAVGHFQPAGRRCVEAIRDASGPLGTETDLDRPSLPTAEFSETPLKLFACNLSRRIAAYIG